MAIFMLKTRRASDLDNDPATFKIGRTFPVAKGKTDRPASLGFITKEDADQFVKDGDAKVVDDPEVSKDNLPPGLPDTEPVVNEKEAAAEDSQPVRNTRIDDKPDKPRSKSKK